MPLSTLEIEYIYCLRKYCITTLTSKSWHPFLRWWACTAEKTLLSFEVLAHDVYNNQSELKYKNRKIPLTCIFPCLPEECCLPLCVFTYSWCLWHQTKCCPEASCLALSQADGVTHPGRASPIRLPLLRLLPSPLLEQHAWLQEHLFSTAEMQPLTFVCARCICSGIHGENVT